MFFIRLNYLIYNNYLITHKLCAYKIFYYFECIVLGDKMQRKDRKRDILEMALKTSGIRNQKKCCKSLLFEFDKVSVQESATLTSPIPPPNATSAVYLNPNPLTTCAIHTSPGLGVSTTSSTLDAVSVTYLNSKYKNLSILFPFRSGNNNFLL